MSNVPLTYPIVLRIVKGHIEASQPDLGIYRIRGKFDDIKHREELGTIILDVWSEIARMVTGGGPIPTPSRPKDVDTRAPGQTMSTRGVARILGVSQETVRRMCKAGKLKCYQTPGGHNRIRFTETLNHGVEN